LTNIYITGGHFFFLPTFVVNDIKSTKYNKYLFLLSTDLDILINIKTEILFLDEA